MLILFVVDLFTNEESVNCVGYYNFFVSSFQAMKEDILNQLETFNIVLSKERDQRSPLALVVDGKALEIALRSDVKHHFLPLAVKCAAVICCRVSPKQKALVSLYSSFLKHI